MDHGYTALLFCSHPAELNILSQVLAKVVHLFLFGLDVRSILCMSRKLGLYMDIIIYDE